MNIHRSSILTIDRYYLHCPSFQLYMEKWEVGVSNECILWYIRNHFVVFSCLVFRENSCLLCTWCDVDVMLLIFICSWYTDDILIKYCWLNWSLCIVVKSGKIYHTDSPPLLVFQHRVHNTYRKVYNIGRKGCTKYQWGSVPTLLDHCVGLEQGYVTCPSMMTLMI